MIAKTNDFPKIRACLFDMDGLLIDSEDIYTKCNNIILQEYGRPNLPWSIKAQLQGRPGPEASEIFHAWAQLPIPRSDFQAKQATLQARYFPTTAPLPGTALLLKTLKAHSIHLALATSSHAANFALKTTHQQPFFSAFPPHLRVLGDDPRIRPGRGKPAPDIYLVALESLNAGLRARGEEEINPEECLVFEDSVLGVEAGRRAGMRVVWCPHPELLREYRGREAEVLAGIANGFFGEPEEEEEEVVAEGDLDEMTSTTTTTTMKNQNGMVGGKTGPPGYVGDGWAELRESLEDFPYRKYGIGA